MRLRMVGKKNNPTAFFIPSSLIRGQHSSPQSPEYQALIPGLDAKGISPEFLLSRLNFFVAAVPVLFLCY
jgi:hypothetical protein